MYSKLVVEGFWKGVWKAVWKAPWKSCGRSCRSPCRSPVESPAEGPVPRGESLLEGLVEGLVETRRHSKVRAVCNPDGSWSFPLAASQACGIIAQEQGAGGFWFSSEAIHSLLAYQPCSVAVRVNQTGIPGFEVHEDMLKDQHQNTN